MGPYNSPESYGLKFVGDVEWDHESYQFNMTAVWRDPETGAFLWADDSGCSCPTPFESTDVGDLTRGTKYDVLNYLAGHRNSAEAMNLIERIQAS